MKKIALLSILISITTLSFSQDNFRQKFLEANTLMEESSYNVALPIWLKLSIEEPDNFNINYKIGICYMNSANEKAKALDYLINIDNKAIFFMCIVYLYKTLYVYFLTNFTFTNAKFCLIF